MGILGNYLLYFNLIDTLVLWLLLVCMTSSYNLRSNLITGRYSLLSVILKLAWADIYLLCFRSYNLINLILRISLIYLINCFLYQAILVNQAKVSFQIFTFDLLVDFATIMLRKILLIMELYLTLFTFVTLTIHVASLMVYSVTIGDEFLGADPTCVWFLACVSPYMVYPAGLVLEYLAAFRIGTLVHFPSTNVRLLRELLYILISSSRPS